MRLTRMPLPSLAHATLSLIRKAVCGLVFSMLIATSIATSASRPALFFYPPPFQLIDGSVISSPVTFSVEQITNLFPKIEEMSGVALLLNWSQVCLTPQQCDFTIIERVLSYWASRNKKVILGVSTIGYPYRTIAAGSPHFESATPDWVLDEVDTYSAEIGTLGRVDNKTTTIERFPSYADPKYRDRIKELVHKLKRFDGHPGISQIRISTGFLTEDNPSPAGPTWLIQGYTDLDWIKYCDEMAVLFEGAFKRSQLEFDLGVVALAYQRGGPIERAAVDRLIENLLAHHVLLAFNGLESGMASIVDNNDQNKSAEVPRIIHYLKIAQRKYDGAGLEALAPITADRLQDIIAIIRIIKVLRPSRLVLFFEVPGSLDRERNGPSARNASATQWLDAQPTAASANSHIHELLTGIGYR